MVTVVVREQWDESIVVVSIEGKCFMFPGVKIKKSICTVGTDFLVGAHLAELLNRETLNLYSSLKRRNIGIRQADSRVVKLLVGRGLTVAGSSSVTLVNKRDMTEYVDNAVAQNERQKAMRPEENRRKQRHAVVANF